MIRIEEKVTTKIPGITSLYITFDYNQDIIALIKEICEVYYYNKQNYTWEVPTTCLAQLLLKFNAYDDIVLTSCNDFIEKTDKHKKYDLLNYKIKPFKHQEEAIQFGLNHNKFLLLDAPGLGKSASVIHIAEELKQHENLQHCLIICGVNTLKNNWKNEIKIHSNLSSKILGERTTKSGKTKIGSIKDRVDDLSKPIDEFCVITNIETIRSNDIVKIIKSGPNKFDMIVFDELHCAKSPTSQQGKNILKLKSKYMIGLTGTVITNSPLDCYVPLKWIGADTSTFTNFKYYYCKYGGYFNNELLGYRNLNVLKKQLDYYSLRRTDDLLDLPEKNVINEYLDMESAQEQFYNNIKEGIIEQVDKVEMTPTSLLAMISRLRQATACPTYLTSENIPSAKLDRAIDLTKEIISNGNKVLIFSTFKESLNILNERLKDLKPLLCTGDIKDEIITQNINKFQEDDSYKIMLATTAKMGTGITLTAATYAIFIDCPWTYALCEQCEKRIHRIGSNKPVFIYYLWCNDSIDLRVKEIVDTKELISDYVVDNVYSVQLYDKLKDIIKDL